MKIVFVDYVLEPDKPGCTGLSDFVWDMASELVNQGHDAHIVASYHTDQFPDARVPVHNFPTPPIGYRNLVGQLWILQGAARVIRWLEPDLIHAPEYVSTAVFASLRIKIPLILTVPGNIFHRIQYGHHYEWFYVQFLKWAALTSARKCAKVIAVSQEMKTWWQKTGSNPCNTPCIPTGVNAERFHEIPDAKSQLGFRNEQQIYLYAGRFSNEKGISDLIQAIGAIKKTIEDRGASFYLIGDGPLMEIINQQIQADGLDKWVIVKRWINKEELALWYSAADAVLLPSYSEGFSRIIPEAMACGTPVIGTKITGTEDHVLDGINGFLFAPHDITGLARILENVIENPHALHCMRATTQKYARENFHWSHIMKRVVREVYLPVLDCA